MVGGFQLLVIQSDLVGVSVGPGLVTTIVWLYLFTGKVERESERLGVERAVERSERVKGIGRSIEDNVEGCELLAGIGCRFQVC